MLNVSTFWNRISKHIIIVFFISFDLGLNAQNIEQPFKVDQITIAVTNVNQMVTFYETVFKCILKEEEINGIKLYLGELAGVKILLCPNKLAKVNAQQNRHQFHFIVTDLGEVIKDVIATRGIIKEEIISTNKLKTVTIIDPDKNTIVFTEKKE